MPFKRSEIRRIALVIGNAGYPGKQRLDKPVNDAKAIAARLGVPKTGLGFRVIGGSDPELPGYDVNLMTMNRLYGKFMEAIKLAKQEKATVHAVIYYAGHGLQIADENYLVPIGASIDGDDPLVGLFQLKERLITIASAVGGDGAVIAFFDACREKPFDGKLIRALADRVRRTEMEQAQQAQVADHEPRITAVSRGFAMPRILDPRVADASDPASNIAHTYIAFATAPGEFAYDGETDSQNSPFTQALCDHIGVRGLEIEEFYNRVQRDVRMRVSRMGLQHKQRIAQLPWSESNLEEPFFFNPRSWWPVVELTALGWIAGLVICYFLFTTKLEMTPVQSNPLLWLTCLPFAAVVGWGSWRWGSGRWLHVGFAVLGTVVAYCLALGILQNPDVLATIKRVGQPDANDIYAAIRPSLALNPLSLTAALLVGFGHHLQNRALPGAWERIGTPLITLLVAWLAFWLVHQVLALHNRQGMLIFAMLSLLAGITLGLGAVLSCKPQLGSFKGFSAATGGMVAGLMMPVIFVFYSLVPSYTALMAIAPVWFAIMGFQLGYCFSYYVSEHRKPN